MAPEKRLILVVDDDRDIREAITDTLVDSGYRAAACADGESALEYLRRSPAPGLILLDWNMIPMNGLEFMKHFSSEPAWAAIPVALVTADSKAEEKAQLAAFAGYLRKPMKLRDLLGLIERHCT